MQDYCGLLLITLQNIHDQKSIQEAIWIWKSQCQVFYRIYPEFLVSFTGSSSNHRTTIPLLWVILHVWALKNDEIDWGTVRMKLFVFLAGLQQWDSEKPPDDRFSPSSHLCNSNFNVQNQNKRNFGLRLQAMEEDSNEYFSSYEDLEIHEIMLTDKARNEAYQRAIVGNKLFEVRFTNINFRTNLFINPTRF